MIYFKKIENKDVKKGFQAKNPPLWQAEQCLPKKDEERDWLGFPCVSIFKIKKYYD